MELSAANPSRFAPTALALDLLTGTHAFEILDQLAERGTVPLAELQHSIGGTSQRTLSRQARALSGHGALKRLQVGEQGVPAPCLSLSEAGRELAEVAELFDELLARANLEVLDLRNGRARSHLVGLIRCGWATSFLPRIAEAERCVADLYAELKDQERRHEWLEVPSRNVVYRMASELCEVGLLASRPHGSEKMYRFTELGTPMIRALLNAYRCEVRHFSDRMAALDPVFVTASFRLVLAGAPLDRLQPGTYALLCKDDDGLPLTGVNVEVGVGGEIAYRSLKASAEAVVVGTPVAWVEAVTQRDPGGLSFPRGDRDTTRMVAALAYTVSGRRSADEET